MWSKGLNRSKTCLRIGSFLIGLCCRLLHEPNLLFCVDCLPRLGQLNTLNARNTEKLRRMWSKGLNRSKTCLGIGSFLSGLCCRLLHEPNLLPCADCVPHFLQLTADIARNTEKSRRMWSKGLNRSKTCLRIGSFLSGLRCRLLHEPNLLFSAD